MKKLFKAFCTSISTFLGILLIVFLTNYLINGYVKINFIQSYLPPFTFIYLPMFITFFFYKKKRNKLDLVTSSIISFITAYIFTFFLFKFITSPQKDIIFLNLNILSLSILGFFTSLLLNFILRIKEKYKIKTIVNNDVKYSFKVIFLIPFSGVFIYSFLIAIDNYNAKEIVSVLYNFLPIGFLFSLISFHFFNYTFSKYNSSKRTYFTIGYYIISISCLVFWILMSVNNFRLISDGFEVVISRNLLIPYIGLYTPFFLYVLVLTHFYFFRLTSKQEKEQLTQQSLESQLNYQQLKNQLSPHFLFNNINVLTSLIEENPKKAVSFSENLSHIYRYFLEQEKQDVVLVKEEIKFAKSYLELLIDRFEVGLCFSILIDEKTKEKYIVSTILQQVLENVIKHNTINELNFVNIEITSKENFLIIKNNKNPKLETVQTSKKGIENIKKRIAFFTDEKVIIESTENSFIIKLPILETV